MMENQSFLLTVDLEMDFSHLLQDPEHSENDLFAGLRTIPLHVEEDPSGVELWLNVNAADATASVTLPSEPVDAYTGR